MTVEEIFTRVISHMYEGVKYHEEMAKAYDFLGLWGFAKCHISHSCEENQGMKQLMHYYATHYFRMLKVEETETAKIIPESWFKYSTQAIDAGTKRNSVKELMGKWVDWEKSTKKFYQEMRQELTAIGELAAAMEIDCYICDVSKELCHAEKKLLKLESLGYDMQDIMEMEDKLARKYKKKLGW